MTPEKVLMVSLAPSHSSAINRVLDCSNGHFDLKVYKTAVDKVNANIASRLVDYVKMFIYLLGSDAKLFWAWGLDACFVVTLAALFKPRKVLLWDITDINPALLKPGLKARILRFVERLLVKRANALTLSSSTFYERYYRGKIASDKVAVIENLLIKRSEKIEPPATCPPMPPCVIVYSGIIRTLRVIHLMAAVAKEMPDEVEFHVHGYPDRTIDQQALANIIAAHPNIFDLGRFKTDELRGIHSKAHLVWAFVDPELSDNEVWLLTNRIYNGVAFGRPVLTNAGTASGDIVEERALGLACVPTAEAIAGLLRSLMAQNGARYDELRVGMPPPSSAYLDGHYACLIERLLAGVDAAS